MAIHGLNRQMLQRPNPQTIQASTLPAPTGGIDARQTLAAQDPRYCIYSYNMEPSEYGMRVRQGYRQWQTDIETAPGLGLGVRTVIPYNGDENDGGADRVFAVTNEGIWDVTTDGGTPVIKTTFAVQTDAAGYGIYTAYTSDAGTDLLFYADGENGLFIYDPDTDAWALATGITGITIEDVRYVTVHKQRIWFCIGSETTGYYLAPGAVAGAATPFYFGNNFKHGGELVGLLNWSVDGGLGLDDYLVAVSRGGDVIPWQGSDPTQADWQARGTYFIGEIPRGNKISADFGGELIILSEFGVTSMADLLQASEARDPSENSVTFKIATILRPQLQALKDELGWELQYLPTQGLLIICVPKVINTDWLQFVLVRTTEGWCFWREVPVGCVDSWRGATIFGTTDNTVQRMDVNRDGATDDFIGNDINFSLLMNYQSLGSQAQFKRGEMIRPTYVGATVPVFNTQFLYDYKSIEIPQPLSFVESGEGVWDLSVWDEPVWSFGDGNSSWAIRGGFDIGRTLAVAIRGRSFTATTLVSCDVMWRAGGYL